MNCRRRVSTAALRRLYRRCPPPEHGCVRRALDSMSRARTLSPPPPSSSSSSPFLPEMAIFRPMGELEAHPRRRSPHLAPPPHAPPRGAARGNMTTSRQTRGKQEERRQWTRGDGTSRCRGCASRDGGGASRGREAEASRQPAGEREANKRRGASRQEVMAS